MQAVPEALRNKTFTSFLMRYNLTLQSAEYVSVEYRPGIQALCMLSANCLALAGPLKNLIPPERPDSQSGRIERILAFVPCRCISPAAGSCLWIPQQNLCNQAEGDLVCTTMGMADCSHRCSGHAHSRCVFPCKSVCR